MPEKRKVSTITIIKIVSLVIGIISLISAVIVMFIDPKDDFYIITSIALLVIGIGFTSYAFPIRNNKSNDDKPIK